MSSSPAASQATTQWKPTDAWLLGIVLAVINFWLFAQNFRQIF